MPTIEVVTDDRHALHDPPHEVNTGRPVSPVWERPARVAALGSGLRGASLLAPTEHGDAPLLAVHDAAMVRFLADAYDRWRASGGPAVMIPDTFPLARWRTSGRRSPSPIGNAGWWCFDTATPVVAGSYVAARAAVDVALTAADRIADGAPLAYALTRPPGHHAGPSYYGGFCLFNPAAVAARRLTEGGRVAVLDVDYHHGNGTQDVFWADGDVLYVSLHGDPASAFPYFSGFADEVGEGRGRGANRNLPLPPGTGDEEYLAACESALATVAAWGAASLVVSVGFDTFADDPIGGFELTTAAYEQVGASIAELGLPTVLVQEGGYDLGSLGRNLASLLDGLRPE